MKRKQSKRNYTQNSSRRLDADGSYNRCRSKTWDSRGNTRNNIKMQLRNENYNSNIVWGY